MIIFLNLAALLLSSFVVPEASGTHLCSTTLFNKKYSIPQYCRVRFVLYSA